jgi:uroporphyrinogen decarboxylase
MNIPAAEGCSMNDTMTPRQRWMSLLNRRRPDRVPTDYWATSEFTERFMRDLGYQDSESLWNGLHIDRPLFVGPTCLAPQHPDDPQANMWGVRHQRIDYGTGAYSEVALWPLANITTVGQVHSHRWPSPDNFDYTSIAAALDASDGTHICHAATYEPFLLYCNLRGLEQGFEDLAVNHDIADAILGHIFDFHIEHNRRIFEAGGGRIDMTYIAEDLGGQTSPLISLDTYRRFLLPNQIRMADLARSFGVHIMYHTDGSARPFIPDLIDRVGIEILNPIQWRCPGMEREGLVRDFGHHVIFHGGMDNQYTLPFGTVEEVKQEVRDNFRIFNSARWICAPCHNIQAVTPTRNVVAMYETIHACNAC